MAPTATSTAKTADDTPPIMTPTFTPPPRRFRSSPPEAGVGADGDDAPSTFIIPQASSAMLVSNASSRVMGPPFMEHRNLPQVKCVHLGRARHSTAQSSTLEGATSSSTDRGKSHPADHTAKGASTQIRSCAATVVEAAASTTPTAATTVVAFIATETYRRKSEDVRLCTRSAHERHPHRAPIAERTATFRYRRGYPPSPTLHSLGGAREGEPQLEKEGQVRGDIRVRLLVGACPCASAGTTVVPTLFR